MAKSRYDIGITKSLITQPISNSGWEKVKLKQALPGKNAIYDCNDGLFR
ncbi:MAG: hypothetical protein V4717_15080 [Bacteroidota bacterium]